MSFNPASEERQLYQIVHFSRKFLLLEKNILWNLLMKNPYSFSVVWSKARAIRKRRSTNIEYQRTSVFEQYYKCCKNRKWAYNRCAGRWKFYLWTKKEFLSLENEYQNIKIIYRADVDFSMYDKNYLIFTLKISINKNHTLPVRGIIIC